LTIYKPAWTVYACPIKPSIKVGTYLLSFVDPELAGLHATHGSVPVIPVAFLQSISRVPQANTILNLPDYLTDHLTHSLQLFAEF